MADSDIYKSGKYWLNLKQPKSGFAAELTAFRYRFF
jgi:hypothetical protein